MDRFIYAANPVQFGFGSSVAAGPAETVSTSRFYASTSQREENAAGGDGRETDRGVETDTGGIMRIPTSGNSIFGTYGEDSLLHLQQRALAEMDMKGVTAASMFHHYHPGTMMDFESPFGGILHPSGDTARSNGNNFQAEMTASLQQQMMQQMASMSMQQHAMHHYSQPASVGSTGAALYPSAMTTPQQQQGMTLMGTGSLANDGCAQSVGSASFQTPFSLPQQHGAGPATSATQPHRQQPQMPSQLRSQTSQSAGLSVPSVVPPSMVPSLSVLGGAVKQSSQLNMHVHQQQRYPVLNGANLADLDTDPRELERFAEHFKQRRIKLGVTQADVGKALAYLKMPGVGSLSQSTICRFESLTLSHNNMVALKPILHSWLEKAEEATKNAMAKDANGEAGSGGAVHCAGGILPCVEKKRKRTSIAAPEKRMLEEFFRQQSRPTGDRISAIADKLDLKKNVVRVWFCNQRQKQKRNQFRHCRNGVGGGSSASIVVSGSANGGIVAGGTDTQNSQQMLVSPLNSSTAAATLAAAAMQAMQQQHRTQHTNAGTTTTAQFRQMKQSQNDDIYGEALLKGQMQLSTSIEISDRNASVDTGGRSVESSGVIRHGLFAKALKLAPVEATNDGTTDSCGIGTAELFRTTSDSSASADPGFYFNRDRMEQN